MTAATTRRSRRQRVPNTGVRTASCTARSRQHARGGYHKRHQNMRWRRQRAVAKARCARSSRGPRQRRRCAPGTRHHHGSRPARPPLIGIARQSRPHRDPRSRPRVSSSCEMRRPAPHDVFACGIHLARKALSTVAAAATAPARSQIRRRPAHSTTSETDQCRRPARALETPHRCKRTPRPPLGKPCRQSLTRAILIPSTRHLRRLPRRGPNRRPRPK